MKLLFTKETNGDIKSQIQQGTITTDFSYIEMVKQLLENPNIEDSDFNNLDEEETSKIVEMLEQIKEIFIEEEDSGDESGEAVENSAE
ncbi:hypothetical protein [Moheibacter sediminis]|uniref:Uncharacterized protein n=1 Tax=Moheibacter sediminis TaxID=1434700 RepID=A0A1W1ZPI0_9FLAO|nr:hypothetical protein [Moheibacter sediminis]SMC50163.1 hypothetical protein SAMN06296427_103127 [Moheibacter sediminis]